MPKFDIDDAAIRKLAELLNETDLTEIEYEVGDNRIRVQRGGVSAAAFAAPMPTAAPAAVGAPAAAAPDAMPAGAVTSPLVGTAYLAAQPGAAPFVKEGDRIKEGQTLLIVEAMKVMNPIAAPRNGTVKEIRISDGQPVEFGEVLVVLE